jgi:membrane-bound lytic murein transglycosylase D
MEGRILRGSRSGSLALACALALAACQAPVRPDPPQADAAATTPEPPASATPDADARAEAAAPPTAPTEPLAEPVAEPAPPLPAMGHGQAVFDRIRRGLSPDACEAGANSVRWRKRFAGHPTVFARHLEEALPMIDFVSIEVERAGLPAEFVFIPLVESWYRPAAIGAGGPAGMWQMIGSTARNHGVHIRPGYDGRLSPVESTRAALSYLKTLQGMFGDWQSIVMAYNAGEGRMRGAFRKARSREVSATRRRPHGLANVTYDYVAKLQALSCLIAEPGRAGLSLPTGARFVPVVAVLVDPSVRSLDDFARMHGVDGQQLRKLNPGFKGGRIVEGVPRLMLTPTLGRQASAIDLASVAVAPAGAPAAVSTAVPAVEDDGTGESPQAQVHEVRRGDSLWKIARQYGLTVDALSRYNGLRPGATVRPGQKLRLAP